MRRSAIEDDKHRLKTAMTIICSLFALLLPSLGASQTAEHPNYPVLVLDRDDGIIAIVDEFDFRTPLAFEKTLAEVPHASVLMLNSPGGLVHSALSIATRVRGLGLTTVILDDNACMSACALVFFAGTKRLAWGALGVHQISSSSGRGDMVGGQFALADVIEAMNEYGVPSEVIGLMLRTPPEEMYIFSNAENRRHGFLTENEPTVADLGNSERTVEMTNPKTWRGKVITGKLMSNGANWYALLNPDGSTTFQFSSGKRSSGRYYLTDREVCFQLTTSQDYACRRPVSGPEGVRWYDEDGDFQSVIVRVDDTNFATVRLDEGKAVDISDHIAPGECALVVASRPTVAEARQYVLANVSDRRFLKAFQAKNGWIAITIGTLKPDEVDPVLAEWKAAGRIPHDSYCSTGANYEKAVSLRLD